jgi:hypothetical protein
MAGQHQAGLQRTSGRTVELPLSRQPRRSGQLEEPDPRDRRDARALRLPTDSCVARREGWDVNGKRVYRLYKELGLQLRRKPPKRRVKAKLRDGRCAASCSNEVWAMDFVHDQLATGSKLRILTVVDTFSRFSPAVLPRFGFRAPDVIEVLERVCSEVGYPASIRVDQGSEFISRRSRSVGLHAQRHARLQPAGQADRQCVHRKLQRQVPGRMPEPTPVHEPRRRGAQMRGLAQRLQRGSAT